jgi:hypothetical protein
MEDHLLFAELAEDRYLGQLCASVFVHLGQQLASAENARYLVAHTAIFQI